MDHGGAIDHLDGLLSGFRGWEKHAAVRDLLTAVAVQSPEPANVRQRHGNDWYMAS